MPRTVVRFQESNDGITRFSLEYPKAYPNNWLYPLQSDPNQPPFNDMRTGDGSPDRVLQAGKKLFDELHSHPAVAPAIQAALLEKEGGCSPICVRLDDSTRADDLPWEAVCENEFFGLDLRWPVVRMREVTDADPVPIYTLEPPLRITAVLSAAANDPQKRVSGNTQWEHIYETLTQHLAEADTVPVSLTVLTGEEELLETINKLKQPWVHAEFISGDKPSLLAAIQKSRPQLLHFFCHGTSEDTPHLRIGSRLDWEAEQDPSIAISARELRQYADPKQNTWLVTLNCCEGAARTADARSLASSLVAAGFPAAVGMREPIDVVHAHALCKAFYPAIMKLIREIPEGQPEKEIEWAKALVEARSALVEKCVVGAALQVAAKGCKVWTIPAFYTRREPFLLKRVAPAPPGLSEQKKRLIEFLRALQQQRAKAPEEYKDLPELVLQGILKDLDQQIAATTAEILKK